MEWLERAVRAGSRNVADLEKADDLKPLCQREDLRRLLRRLREEG